MKTLAIISRFLKIFLWIFGVFVSNFSLAQISPTISKNYMIVQLPQAVTSSVNELNDYTKTITKIQYSDGFDRPLETIHYRASPTGNDIVSGVNDLDNFGRPIKSYLSVPTGTQTGAYTSNISSLTQSFYGDSNPYQVTQYGASYIRSMGAGSAVQNVAKYTESKGIIVGNGMRRYIVMSDQTTVTLTYFTSNELSKSITIDENNNQLGTYTDREGKKIQEDQVNSQTGEILSTAYIYDDIGRLRYVLPPKAFKNGNNFDETGTYFDSGVYAFRYDEQGRLVETHKPNGGWSYSVYNELGQVVMSQDPRQRQYNQWEWVHYDGHGRKVMSGIYSSNIDRASLQSLFNNYAQEQQFEERGYDLLAYTNRSFPITVSSNDVQCVYYYDDYNWVSDASYNFTHYKTSQYTNVKGLATGSLVKNLSTGAFLKSVIYYDDRNRPIQTLVQNRFYGQNQTDIVYNFTGQILEERTIYRKPNNAEIQSKTVYSYDHVGRKKGAVHFLNNKLTPLAQYKYDEVGRLVQKRLMQAGDDIIIENTALANGKQDIANRYVLLNSGTITAQNGTYLACVSPNVLQVIDYSYTIQGQLRNMNAHADGGSSTFNLTLDHNETGQYYNGNLAKQTWNSPAGGRSFSYNYDGYNRLQNANYGGVGSENYSMPNVSYDENGNITNLQRNGFNGGGFGQIDYLQYTYQNASVGNQLQGIQDYTGNTKGFKDNGTNSDYLYWNDGSLLSDANKGIQSISYNFKGLPDFIYFNTGQYIQNAYDAEGVKLSQTVYNGSTYVRTDYMGDLIYRNDSLKSILTDEGRIYFPSGTPPSGAGGRYQFFIIDHLGNTRVIIERQSATTAVFQTTDYGAWGEILEGETGAVSGDWKFLFQGKEYIDANGLNLFDFGTRQYDAYRGQFNGIDPVDNYSVGGTVGMMNNPLSYIDPDGREPISIGAAIAIGALVGALTNTASQVIQNNGFNNWSWGSFALSTAIGGATGALGFGLGNATAGWGTVGGGIATGAGTGFVGGGLSSLAGGGNFWKGAWKGALWGGAIGGAMGILKSALVNGKTDYYVNDNPQGNGSLPATDEYLNEFTNKKIGNPSTVDIKNLEVANANNLPDGVGYNAQKGTMSAMLQNGKVSDNIYGVTRHYAPWFSKAYSDVYIASGAFNYGENFLYQTVGHEWIHAFHNLTFGGRNVKGNYTEASANDWSSRISLSYPPSGLNAQGVSNSFLGVSQSYGSFPASYHWNKVPLIFKPR